MPRTRLLVRCSGRKEYAGTLAGTAVLAYAILAIHNWVEFPPEIPLAVLGIVALLSIFGAFVRAKIQYLEMDSEGLKMHVGLFNKQTVYVPYERITNTKVKRTLSERLFMLGTLEVDTAGTGRTEIIMHNIPSRYLDTLSRGIQKRIRSLGERRR